MGTKIASLYVGYPMFLARLLPFYLVGVVAYRFRNHLVPNDWLAITAVTLLVALSRIPLSWTVALPILFGYLVFRFAYHPKIHLHRFGQYGDFSYGIYLDAIPVQQLVVLYLGNAENGKFAVEPLELFAISMPLSIIAGVLNWFVVERWFN